MRLRPPPVPAIRPDSPRMYGRSPKSTSRRNGPISSPAASTPPWPATRSPTCTPRSADPPFLLAGDAASVTRPHTASGAVKALQDALCLEQALRESPAPADALRHYARERTAEGARLMELGRRLGGAQVERTPDWTAMDQDAVDAWCRATLAGSTSYLYGDIR
ncbi:hypothetical protein NKH18_41475 [Streptomyces sp. M10(2022)]